MEIVWKILILRQFESFGKFPRTYDVKKPYSMKFTQKVFT